MVLGHLKFTILYAAVKAEEKSKIIFLKFPGGRL